MLKYVRLFCFSPEEEERNREKRELLTRPTTIEELVELKGLSKKKVKKRLRNPNKNFDGKKKIKFEICTQCTNPRVCNIQALVFLKIVLNDTTFFLSYG